MPGGVMVEVEALRKSYRVGGRALPVLHGASLRIGRGEFVAIMGASGSGKSTLLSILGLLESYEGGRYTLAGHDTRALGEDRAAKLRNALLGFVFQSFHLLSHKTAWENVALPLAYAGVARPERRRRALSLLARLGLDARAEHRPDELSGGQRQRVAIARALANNPPVILADEPTGNLDSRTSGEVMQLFREIHARGRTIVLVTHEPAVAAAADRVILVRDGRVVQGNAAGDAAGEAP
jgi:putative ABC transport system ATP-binding protein